ncbi:MAG: 30S ribosomal protein S17 [Anaerolineales bacterium]|jgi:small subunit ribosomal protein S17
MTNKRRRLVGVVTRANSEKTVVVQVDRSIRHPLYGKVMRDQKSYLAHDELGCRLGDQVRLVESRPISKRKHWAVEEIIERQTEAEIQAAEVKTLDEVTVEAEE